MEPEIAEQEVKDIVRRAAYVNKRFSVVLRLSPGIRYEELPGWRQFAYLNGRPINKADAAQTYKVSIATIFFWAKSGLIREIGKRIVTKKGVETLYNEADVAYCAYLHYKQMRKRRKKFPEIPVQPIDK